jgi:hypothetical protein
MTNNTNFYELTYKQEIATPGVLIANVSRSMMATNHSYLNQTDAINMNDAVNSIQIYNAQAMGFGTGNYSAVGTDHNGLEIPLDDAMYNAGNDRLVWMPDPTSEVGLIWL